MIIIYLLPARRYAIAVYALSSRVRLSVRPWRSGNFMGSEWRPVSKYKDTLPWAMQKRLNRSTWRLGWAN